MPEQQPVPVRVLIVEDEFLIRLTLAEALGDEGFDVLEAETGDAALPMLVPGCGIQLLLTDIQLPGSLNGRALATRVRQLLPNLPVIYMTGRLEPDSAGTASPLDAFIAKPYTLTDICEAARRLTGASAGV